jgi:hypothetical protein
MFSGGLKLLTSFIVLTKEVVEGLACLYRPSIAISLFRFICVLWEEGG